MESDISFLTRDLSIGYTSRSLNEILNKLTKQIDEKNSLQGLIIFSRKQRRKRQIVLWLLRVFVIGWFIPNLQSAVVKKDKELFDLSTKLRSFTGLNFKLDDRSAFGYSLITKAFQLLVENERIWLVESETATNRFRDRTSASASLNLIGVSLGWRKFDQISIDLTVPMIPILTYAELLFYPAFIALIRYKDEEKRLLGRIDLISYQSADVDGTDFPFHESREHVPSDSDIIGTTYLYVNKDGSPDMRRVNNREIPVLEYFKTIFLLNAFKFTLVSSSPKKSLPFKKALSHCGDFLSVENVV